MPDPFVIGPASIPICPWIPSSRGASAPLIAATIAFAWDDSCSPEATGVIVLQGACTTAGVDAADLSACSRRSSAQCFSIPSSFQSSRLPVFCSRDLLATTDLAQILRLLLGSPFLGPDTAREVPISLLCSPSQIH